jgi:alpha(1,3/1,4) fucosyltransferase
LKKTIAIYAHKESKIYNDFFIKNHSPSNAYKILVKALTDLGYIVHTLDIYIKRKSIPEICIFLDIPKIKINQIYDFEKSKKIVLIREPEMISGQNYNKKLHDQFDYLFTWKYDLIDKSKYFFLHGAKVDLNKKIIRKELFYRKLCCLINSNLKSNLKGELYSKRYDFIKWFEINNIENFDLYGYKWDKKNILLFGRNIYLPSFFSSNLISYKGRANNKIKTLSNYKFSICFENTHLEKDYISEKIFDCFLANTVPIYLGCPNINELIPKNSFIDYRDFKNKEELYNFITNISKEKYSEYINNINLFLESESIKKYTLNSWLTSIIKIIKK